MKEASGGIEPPVGQNIIKLISNLCFSVFVFSVLIFTVIAITYQPPDPWLESAPALTKFFTESENATFKIDNSVLKTGEDMQTGPSPAIPPSADTKPITEEVIEKAEELIVKSEAKTEDLTEKSVEKANKTESVSEVSEGNANKMEGVSEVSEGNANKMEGVVEKANKTQGVVEKSEEAANATLKPSGCEELKVINCSDPRVLITVERFNLKLFKSLVFLEYQTPVNGSKPDECDIAWRFRNKKEKSWRKYRDFRRFQFTRGDNCVYKIVHAGSWHSGINARRPRIKFNATRSGGKSPKITPQFRDDEINDTIPTLGSEMNFRKGRYLYYSRGGDYCKSMNHYMWSFLCGLGEAMYLNRTFVLDLSMCLSGSYNSHGKDEEGKDFRYYFDFEHLKEVASIVEEGEFLKGWRRWNRSHKKKLPVKKVLTHKVSPMQLKKDKSSIIWRHFDAPEPENYWYRVCEGQAAKYIQRPWHALWKSKRLMNIVTEIGAQMDWDFDAVHVVRGEKAQNKELWPHLDADTSPDTLVAKLQGMVQSWRHLYIATNEPFYNYFDKLRSHYKVHLLDDYKALWGNTSEWYNETTLLNNRKPVEFDGYMRVAVDTEVFYRAKTRVETFYNLTSDCKDGINTC